MRAVWDVLCNALGRSWIVAFSVWIYHLDADGSAVQHTAITSRRSNPNDRCLASLQSLLVQRRCLFVNMTRTRATWEGRTDPQLRNPFHQIFLKAGLWDIFLINDWCVQAWLIVDDCTLGLWPWVA